MSLLVSPDLPACQVLQEEGLVVVTAPRPTRQTLRILLLNLMPEKIKTETQIGRMLGATSLLVELVLLTTASYQGKHTSPQHLKTFYTTWEKIHHQHFDGLIITGAPIENMTFEHVHYWRELTQILDWALDNVTSVFTLCWAAQAALYHWYGISKYVLPYKQFGLYSHSVVKDTSVLVAGLTTPLIVPVSRYAEVRRADIETHPALSIVLESEEVGICLVEDASRLCFFMLNHLEYDVHTLGEEYLRDQRAGKPTPLPYHYFPDDDPRCTPVDVWRTSGYRLFGNWLSTLVER